MKFLLVVMFVLVMMFSWCHGQDLDGSYDSNGVWMPKDKTISQTYKLPDLSTGFLVSRKTIYSVLGIELYDRKAKAIDFLVGSNILALSISKRWSSVLEFKTGLWAGFSFESDFNRKGWIFGVSVLLSKF